MIIIARRPGSKLAQASLRPRCRRGAYVDTLAGLVHGLWPSGWSQKSKGMAVLDEARFLDRMGELGIALSGVWSSADYRRRRDHDLALWRSERAGLPRRHPIEAVLVAHLCRRMRVACR